MIGWVRRERRLLLATLVASALTVSGLFFRNLRAGDSITEVAQTGTTYTAGTRDGLFIIEKNEPIRSFPFLSACADLKSGFHYERDSGHFQLPEAQTRLDWGAFSTGGFRGSKKHLVTTHYHEVTFDFAGFNFVQSSWSENDGPRRSTGWLIVGPIATLVFPLWLTLAFFAQIGILVIRQFWRRRSLASRGFPVANLS